MFLVCSFTCVVFLCLLIIFFNLLCLRSPFPRSRKVELFPRRRLNSFFLLVSALLRLVQWFVWVSCKVRFVLSFCLFVFPLMGKAEWGGTPVYWWLGLYFCFVCCVDETSYTGCYWWVGDIGSCIQEVSFVWVLTIWYTLGDAGACWAAVYGVAQSRTRLKRCSSSSSSRVSSLQQQQG